jgi:hypothetical protein
MATKSTWKPKPSDIALQFAGERPHYDPTTIPLVHEGKCYYPDVTTTWDEAFASLPPTLQARIMVKVHEFTSEYQARKPEELSKELFVFRVRNWVMQEHRTALYGVLDIRAKLQQQVRELEDKLEELRRDVRELRRD